MQLKSDLLFNLLDVLNTDAHEFVMSEHASDLLTEHRVMYRGSNSEAVDIQHPDDLAHAAYQKVLDAHDQYYLRPLNESNELQHAVDYTNALKSTVTQYENSLRFADL